MKKILPQPASQLLSTTMSAVEVPLTKGYFAKISACDADVVGGHKWYANEIKRSDKVYAYTSIKGRLVGMHRLILGVNGRRTPYVDHIDWDGLNNQRDNLRLVTPAQNTRWSRTARTYVGLRGVSAAKGKWMATICCDGKTHYLGTYASEREAGIAYQAASKVLFGEFSVSQELIE